MSRSKRLASTEPEATVKFGTILDLQVRLHAVGGRYHWQTFSLTLSSPMPIRSYCRSLKSILSQIGLDLSQTPIFQQETKRDRENTKKHISANDIIKRHQKTSNPQKHMEP